MKEEYYKVDSKLKQERRGLTNSWQASVRDVFEKYKQCSCPATASILNARVEKAQMVKKLDSKFRGQILRYFIDRERKEFNFLRSNGDYILSIMSQVHTNIEGYELSWRELNEDLLQTLPVIAIKKVQDLHFFVKIVNRFFDCNNAVDVISYFLMNRETAHASTFRFISQFVNINDKTDPKTIETYFTRLLECRNRKVLKGSISSIFMKSIKNRKSNIFPDIVYKECTQQVIETSFRHMKNDQVNVITKFIGKSNPYSVQIINHVFQLVGNYLRPFENGKKYSHFLNDLVRKLASRIQKENKARTSLQKALVRQANDKQQKPSEEDDDDSDEEDEDDQETTDNKYLNDEQINDLDEQQPLKELEDMQKSPLEDKKSKREKLQLLLLNQITPQLLQVIKGHFDCHFENLFLANLKELKSSLLNRLFQSFPKFVARGLTLIDKCSHLLQINEQELVNSLRVLGKYIFYPKLPEEDRANLLFNVLKIFQWIGQTRKISDVWCIVVNFFIRIPLLDEKDYQEVPEKVKAEFETKFNYNHDRFYQTYSQTIFEFLKRLLKEVEDQDSNQTAKLPTGHLLANSYPNFKRRVLKLLEEAIDQRPSDLTFRFLEATELPSSLKMVILNKYHEINKDNDQNFRVLTDLMWLVFRYELIPFETFKLQAKTLVRKTIDSYLQIAHFNLTWSPFESSLDYITCNPGFRFSELRKFQDTCKKLTQFQKYSQKLVQQLEKELQTVQADLLQTSLADIIHKMYSSNQKLNSFSLIEKKKTVNQILKILSSISIQMPHQIIRFDTETQSVLFTTPQIARTSLLDNPKFVSLVNKICHTQIFLHDEEILSNLSMLLNRQVLFSYFENCRNLKGCRKIADQFSLPEECTPMKFMRKLETKAKVILYSKLLLTYTYPDSFTSFETVLDSVKILVLAHNNSQVRGLLSVILRMGEATNKQLLQLIVDSYKMKIDSRFYWNRLQDLFVTCNSVGLRYTKAQIIDLLDSHASIMQHDNVVVRELGIKSFTQILQHLNNYQVSGDIEESTRKYIAKQKLQSIWILSIISILNKPYQNPRGTEMERAIFIESQIKNLNFYMKTLEKMILSDIRLMRIVSLYVYAACYRRAKKLVSDSQKKTIEPKQYAPLNPTDLLQYGFLREEHRLDETLKHKNLLEKAGPYHVYEIKRKLLSEQFDKLQKQSYQFLLRNTESVLTFLTRFHTDLVSSFDELLSIVFQSGLKQDLGDVPLKMLKTMRKHIKTRKLISEQPQSYFGERFFRYLFVADAKNGYTFFLATKQVVLGCLNNTENLDNRVLLMIYLNQLMSSLQKYYQLVPQGIRKQIEEFILKIMEQCIYKSSGQFFKTIMVVFKDIKKVEVKQFLIKYAQTMIEQKQKLPRAGYLYLMLSQNDFKCYLKVLGAILSSKDELDSSFIDRLVHTLVKHFEKHLLDANAIKEYRFIDLEKELAAYTVVPFTEYTYVVSKKELNAFFVNAIDKYFHQQEAKAQPETSDAGTQKTMKSDIVKNVFNIATNAMDSFLETRETSQMLEMLKLLLRLAFKIIQKKGETEINCKQLISWFSHFMTRTFVKSSYFQELLEQVLLELKLLSPKKQAQFLQILTKHTKNYYKLSKEKYLAIVTTVARFEQSTLQYKDLMINIYSLLSHRSLTEEEVASTQVGNSLTKGQKILVLQAHLLSTLQIQSPYVATVLKEANKDRLKIWCKQLLAIRGKREQLDDEKQYEKWKQIKQYSNPYHYHV